MDTVYLDRDQCQKFGCPYFEAGSTAIAADAILTSKPQGYDVEMNAALKDADEDTLVLARDEEDAPGWYAITKVIPSWKRPQATRDAFKAANGIA